MQEVVIAYYTYNYLNLFQIISNGSRALADPVLKAGLRSDRFHLRGCKRDPDVSHQRHDVDRNNRGRSLSRINR
jgi:hypothetical protein